MPALSSLLASNASLPLNSTANNSTTGETLQVVCAWPVSGQYGPGTRILYYVLVAACVLGRGSEWLRDACLAAALLLPAVAALHGIVLAAVHVDGAVDMDVYGAFQLCAIGVLAGPVTVRISKTYFNTPGRNLIFLWTGMILSGLLSLTVEFFRANSVSCAAGGFSYGEDSCNLTCSVAEGPHSPLRGGSQNNIYVIEAPDMLSFGTATLLAAACCIPAILSLVGMWNKILKLNWKKRFGDVDDEGEDAQEPSAVSKAKMLNVNDRIRFFLSMVEIPVFSAAILAILIVGERNFFSYQVAYMSEPITSVGQWAPIVGTGLAALGSLYALLATDAGKEGEPGSLADARAHHCTCAHHHHHHHLADDDGPSAKIEPQGQNEDGAEVDHVETPDGPGMSRRQTYESIAATSHASRRLTHTTTRGTVSNNNNNNDQDVLYRSSTTGTARTAGDAGNRRKVEAAFEWIGQKLGTPAPDAFDDSAFQIGPAADFPTVPGEEQRNTALPQIKASYNLPRDSDGHITPNNMPQRSRSRSRAESFTSGVSGLGIEGLTERASQDSDPMAGPSRAGEDRPRERRATLEVPKQSYHSPVPRRESSYGWGSDSNMAVKDGEQSPTSPTIRVSPEPEALE